MQITTKRIFDRYFIFFPRKCNLFTQDIYVLLQQIHDKRRFLLITILDVGAAASITYSLYH